MSKLIEYSPTEAALADLRHRYGNVVFDLSTTKGDKEARAARKELVGLRTDLEAKRKELKAPTLERSRLIDAEAARIKGEIESLEEPIDAQIKADEVRREAERQAKAAKESQRIAKHQAALDALRSVALCSVGDHSESLTKTIAALDATTIGEDWEEFQPIAQRAKDDGLATLRDLHAKAVAAEAEAVRIAAERAELERLRAEQAQAAAAQAQRQGKRRRCFSAVRLTDVLGVRLIRERKDMRKSLQFKVEPLRHKWPLFAFGVMGGGNEFVLSLWLIDFRISWGY